MRVGADAVPAVFRESSALLRAAIPRPDIRVVEQPAPLRLAAHALALGLELDSPAAGAAAADGRFVLLHHPGGQPGWGDDTRVVAYARAGLDGEMTRDPLLAEAVWSWLLEGLHERGARVDGLRGTVTTTASRHFGGEAEDAGEPGADEDPEVGGVELRCSWTPLDPDGGPVRAPHLLAHLEALAGLLAAVAGAPPLSPGVLPLRPR